MTQRRPLPHSAVKIQKFKSQAGETIFCDRTKLRVASGLQHRHTDFGHLSPIFFCYISVINIYCAFKISARDYIHNCYYSVDKIVFICITGLS